jgi:uncharacterized protein YaaW (UPF0174 family)
MPYNDRLFDLLRALDDTELQTLWEKALRCAPDVEAFATSPREQRIHHISKAWRAAHGHTLRNRLRDDHDLQWKRILVDVADQLRPGMAWPFSSPLAHCTESEIEQTVLQLFDQRTRAAWERMSAADRQKLADGLDAELAQNEDDTVRQAHRAGLRRITVASLGNGISAGLLGGSGLLLLAQGSASALVGGLLGGAVAQLGFWLLVRLFGVWAGGQMALGGGAAAVGGALLSAPAALVFGANLLMSTSYRKSIPATLMLLSAHEQRRQLAALADDEALHA